MSAVAFCVDIIMQFLIEVTKIGEKKPQNKETLVFL